MKKLAKPIMTLIIEEFGEKEFFRRISDPLFFQSFSNVLGFDWNSSGSTTVLTGVLKSVLNCSDFEIRVAGGKGNAARKTPEQIALFSEELGIGKPEELIRISKLAAKIDNAALQDGYDIYHHAIIFSRKYWTIVQQGMNEAARLARRYHWSHWSFDVKPKIEERIHSGIVAERREKEVMNLVADKSGENREIAVDIVRDGRFRREYKKLLSVVKLKGKFVIPRRIDWKVIEKAHNLQPDRFEDLLLVKGVGKAAVRALALIADLIYNAEYDRQDPAKYCFAVGGKDGIPFPVDRESYDGVIEFMRDAIRQAELGDFEKRDALKRLSLVI
jgi:hypothetical protein